MWRLFQHLLGGKLRPSKLKNFSKSTFVPPAETQHHHAALTSALEACLCCFCPAHPAPATRSKPSVEARSPSPEPPNPTINRAHITPPESPLRPHVKATLPLCCQTLWTPLSGMYPFLAKREKLQRLVGNVVDVTVCADGFIRVAHHIDWSQIKLTRLPKKNAVNGSIKSVMIIWYQ